MMYNYKSQNTSVTICKNDSEAECSAARCHFSKVFFDFQIAVRFKAFWTNFIWQALMWKQASFV